MNPNVKYTIRILEEISKIPGVNTEHIIVEYLRSINWVDQTGEDAKQILIHFKKLAKVDKKLVYDAIIEMAQNVMLAQMLLISPDPSLN